MTLDGQPHFFDGEISTLIEGWSTTITHIAALAGELTNDEWTRQSPCPGWTVGDVVAHIVAVERQLARDDLVEPEPDWSSLRGSSRGDVVAELFEVIPRRTAQLQSLDADPDALVAGPAGSQVPLGRIMRMRVFDLWVHEQDIRVAIDQPGHDATSGAHVTADILVSTLPILWGKKVGAQPGQSLDLRVAGGISFECTVAVGDDGRAKFIAAGPAPTTTITTDWLTYVALGTGRVAYSGAEDRVTISGDLSLGVRALELVNIAP